MTTMLNREEIVDLVRRGKRAKARGRAAQKIATGLLTSALFALAGGFELMIAVGIAHAEWIRSLPTIGYWWAVLLVTLLRGTFSAVRPSAGEAGR